MLIRTDLCGPAPSVCPSRVLHHPPFPPPPTFVCDDAVHISFVLGFCLVISLWLHKGPQIVLTYVHKQSRFLHPLPVAAHTFWGPLPKRMYKYVSLAPLQNLIIFGG